MTNLTFVTLGPAGSCHENAVRHYRDHHGIDASIAFVEDFMVGLESIRGLPDHFLVQCSAHPLVHVVTERYWDEIFVIDTFIYPTKELALLTRRDVDRPRSLGIVPATTGYINLDVWDDVTYESSKPIVARKLRAGCYDAGLTHLEYAVAHPSELRVELVIGAVDTTWVVYGCERRVRDSVIACPMPAQYRSAARAR